MSRASGRRPGREASAAPGAARDSMGTGAVRRAFTCLLFCRLEGRKISRAKLKDSQHPAWFCAKAGHRRDRSRGWTGFRSARIGIGGGGGGVFPGGRAPCDARRWRRRCPRRCPRRWPRRWPASAQSLPLNDRSRWSGRLGVMLPLRSLLRSPFLAIAGALTWC